MRTGETSRRAAALAHRLRLLQVDFADEDATARMEYLAGEVERALADVVPDQRTEFLGALTEQFPTWDAGVSLELLEKPQANQTGQSARGATDEREIRDPGFLIARLAELASNLDEKHKRVLQQDVALAGLAPAAPAGGAEIPPESLERLLGKLQLNKAGGAASADNATGWKPVPPPDLGRLTDLTAIVAELAGSLDQLVWIAWREMAPNSTIRHTAELRRMMARFLSGDTDISRTQVAEEVEKLRKLIASLISAVKMTGRQFATALLARFSPTEIKSLVDTEGHGFMVSREVKCWRKYVELAGTMDEASVENEINNSIVSSAESLMKGLSRG